MILLRNKWLWLSVGAVLLTAALVCGLLFSHFSAKPPAEGDVTPTTSATTTTATSIATTAETTVATTEATTSTAATTTTTTTAKDAPLS